MWMCVCICIWVYISKVIYWYAIGMTKYRNVLFNWGIDLISTPMLLLINLTILLCWFDSSIIWVSKVASGGFLSRETFASYRSWLSSIDKWQSNPSTIYSPLRIFPQVSDSLSALFLRVSNVDSFSLFDLVIILAWFSCFLRQKAELLLLFLRFWKHST